MFKSIALFIISVSLLSGGSHLFMKEMQKSRVYMTPYKAKEGDKPEIVLATTMLGGFRGLLIDVLWLRAIQLQDEGKYFELNQLYDLIGKLEPRFASVWNYSAWNLSYNVSVEMPTKEERWEWVKAGINLIREKGLYYCPKNEMLYDQISWIFLHKMSGSSDWANPYYKEKIAEEMEWILGEEQDLDAIRNAPDELSEFKLDVNNANLYNALALHTPFLENEFLKVLVKQAKPSKKLGELLEDEKNKAPITALANFIRKKKIKSEIFMDLDHMISVRDEFGKLDWRATANSALYWITLGKKQLYFDKLSFNRMEINALKESFFMGRAFAFKDKFGYRRYEFGPDFDRARAVHNTYIKYMKRYPSDGPTSTFYYAYRHFLETIMVELMVSGKEAEAQSFYDEGAPFLQDFRMPRTQKEFMQEAFKKILMDPTEQQHMMVIFGPIQNYYFKKIIQNDEEQANKYLENFALPLLKQWRNKYDKADNKKLRLGKLSDIKAAVLKNMIRNYSNKYHASIIDKLKNELSKFAPKENESEK